MFGLFLVPYKFGLCFLDALYSINHDIYNSGVRNYWILGNW